MAFHEAPRALAQWTALGAAVGVVSGAAAALFLALLDLATDFRLANRAIVFALPLAGLAIGVVYGRFGLKILGGNNLVIDTVHEDSPEIPFRMAPMVLIGTVLTHLFGGSAGREGTAVQMGASLADWLSHRLRVGPDVRRELLSAGIAGGFGAVFGTPVAGAIFGLEVVVIGRLRYDALVPALVAAVVGDVVARALGAEHSAYPLVAHLPLSPVVLAKWLVVAAAVAAVATAFIELTHRLKSWSAARVPSLPLRMALGGAVIVVLWGATGTDDYLGLGVPTILRAFVDPTLPVASFALKLVFTAVTLGAGFLGGEVTPLFFIGATLGNVLGRLLGLPLDVATGVGMAAMFAAAANTPLSLSIMAVELLGMNVLPHVTIVAVVAYLLTGHRGIYPAQRIARHKYGGPLFSRLWTLRDLPKSEQDGATEPRPPGVGEREP